MKCELCGYEVMETMLYFPSGTVPETCLHVHVMAEARSPDTPSELKWPKESATV